MDRKQFIKKVASFVPTSPFETRYHQIIFKNATFFRNKNWSDI